MARLGDEQRKFLDENPYVGTVTDLREDGSPHSTIVWVDASDGTVGFNSARGRAKVRHLERDPRLSLLVVDPNDAYKWVAVDGHADVNEEGADEQIDKLAKKYIGEDKYPWRDPSQRRLKVLIEAEHVGAYGFDD